MDSVMFGGFPERAPKEALPSVDWNELLNRTKYNDAQMSELDHIADSTEEELEGSVIGEHDQNTDLLNKADGFSHAQAVSGRAGEIVTARLSRRTKLIIGGVATAAVGFAIGFGAAVLPHPDTTPSEKPDPCAEQASQSTNTDPSAILVQLANCRQNETLSR